MDEGLKLQDVLNMFIADLRELELQPHGRVVCHHAEFDFGIIDRELQRCGMEEERVVLKRCATSGYCTMNPAIGGWLKTGFGRDASPESKGDVMKLKTLVSWLMPESAHLLERHHTAGADAALHRLLYFKLCEIAGSAGM